MIAKLLFPIVLGILLTCIYLHRYYWQRRWMKTLGWFVGVVGIYATISLSLSHDYFPDNIDYLLWYLHLLCLVIVPAVLFSLCSLIGRLLKRHRGGNRTGVILSVVFILIYLYGTFVGPQQFEVVRVSYTNKDLPAAFDGYRIVQVSDLHVGTYTGDRRQQLQEVVDSINAEKADLVVFVGDLQNKRPEEITACRQVLSQIQAKDGVLAVLGNHDYAEYQGGDAKSRAANCEKTVQTIRSLGWDLLLNEHRVLYRQGDSIVVAGMENDGVGRFPQKGDMSKTLSGVDSNAFILMLEHDPTSWRRKIVPDGRAQLTLSGHTHGGQMTFFGWSPARLTYDAVSGRFDEGRQTLFVTKGAGGVIPFRFATPREIVVITMKR